MYAVHFFELNANSVANRLRDSTELLVSNVREKIRLEGRFSEEDIESTVAKVSTICCGDLPVECDTEYFHALCWLSEVLGDKVNIGPFYCFKRANFLTETGIWPFLASSHPFSIPRSIENPPQAGFLTAKDMELIALPGLYALPPSDLYEANDARSEFIEVIESLSEDNLDLLAVFL